jgi:putative ABC transport system substrate-binding protein
LRRVGVLLPFPENDPFTQAIKAAFTDALRSLGWIEGQNIRVDYRFAAGDPALFRAYAPELVALSPDAILASTPPAVEALRQQTRTIPIVFVLVQDPVGLGLVQSLARPGGNMTGLGAAEPPIMGKWLQLLKEIAPSLTRVAVIFNPDTQPYARFFYQEIETAAPTLGVTMTLAPVHDDAGIEDTIAVEARRPSGGLIALPDPFMAAHRDVIIAAATRHGLPLIGTGNVFPRAGALMSYWYDPVEPHAQAASYIDRILRGGSPADLPVQYPTKYSLVINLKTAKALGLTVPPGMLDLADEVID